MLRDVPDGLICPFLNLVIYLYFSLILKHVCVTVLCGKMFRANLASVFLATVWRTELREVSLTKQSLIWPICKLCFTFYKVCKLLSSWAQYIIIKILQKEKKNSQSKIKNPYCKVNKTKWIWIYDREKTRYSAIKDHLRPLLKTILGQTRTCEFLWGHT